jgi:hypothetical protein
MNLWVWAVLLNQSEPTWIDLMTDEPLSNLAPDPELPDWRVGEMFLAAIDPATRWHWPNPTFRPEGSLRLSRRYWIQCDPS